LVEASWIDEVLANRGLSARNERDHFVCQLVSAKRFVIKEPDLHLWIVVRFEVAVKLSDVASYPTVSVRLKSGIESTEV
jgi:hypothetical protein